MTYESINGTLMGQDLMYLFVYANEVTSGFFGPLMVLSFFIIVFVSSMLMQYRFTTRIRPDTSLLAASFVTLGFATIIEQRTGIISPWFFVTIIGVTVLSAIWVFMGRD